LKSFESYNDLSHRIGVICPKAHHDNQLTSISAAPTAGFCNPEVFVFLFVPSLLVNAPEQNDFDRASCKQFYFVQQGYVVTPILVFGHKFQMYRLIKGCKRTSAV